jgi:hypothetical protein
VAILGGDLKLLAAVLAIELEALGGQGVESEATTGSPRP